MDNFPDSLKHSENLSTHEKRAIKSLKNNKSIVVLPSDKGNSVVIQNLTDYVHEAERQLNDTSTYLKLDEDPSENFNEDIQGFLKTNAAKEDITDKTLAILTPQSPRTPVFYTLPKTHKDVRPPPGRPIVSSYGCASERISAYVDDILQPFVKSLKSYVKDTNHFLSRLMDEVKEPLSNNTFLVTVDVESLYTNIPLQEGLEASQLFLNSRPNNVKPSSKFVLALMNMVLTMNNFKFQNQNYIQIKGTAMGTRMAPTYANLFMGVLEENFLNSVNELPLLWLRYIDDIFFLWSHGLDSLQIF